MGISLGIFKLMASCLTENEARGFSCSECFTILCSFFSSFLFYLLLLPFSFLLSITLPLLKKKKKRTESPLPCSVPTAVCALPTFFFEHPLFLCQTTFILPLPRLPLVSQALSCPHPGPPLPHTRSLPVHGTAGDSPLGAPSSTAMAVAPHAARTSISTA